jgi:5'-3' exoribonuclease 1
MGIPAFFSYIIKNHSAILTNLKHTNVRFASLYMDCNSIVYDAYYSLCKKETPPSSVDMQTQIVDIVIQTIEIYIEMIQPSKLVYIAFDGVAPFAKMEQQRTRRYKTDFLASLTPTTTGPPSNGNFLTSMITPGTHFMEL